MSIQTTIGQLPGLALPLPAVRQPTNVTLLSQGYSMDLASSVHQFPFCSLLSLLNRGVTVRSIVRKKKSIIFVPSDYGGPEHCTF